jgi:hypothetical protein
MEQIRNFADKRQLAWCVHCGGLPETRDHIPSRVLLDEPFPENLAVVPACKTCNDGFSLDEQYLACLLDCVIVGSTDVTKLRRAKVRRMLAENPALVQRIELARKHSVEGSSFAVEADRVKNVITKLARGHALFELNELLDGAPSKLTVMPLHQLTPGQLQQFESPLCLNILPEVGSRGMQRAIETGDLGYGWLVLQEGRYRYLAAIDNGVVVRMVLSEYLACEARWDDSWNGQPSTDTYPTRAA